MSVGAMVHEDEVMGKAYDHRLMRRLLGFLRPYGKHMLVAFVLIFATGAAELAAPYLVKIAIDEHIVPGNADTLGGVFVLYVLSLLAAFVFRYTQNYLMQYIGQRVMYDIRLRIFGH